MHIGTWDRLYGVIANGKSETFVLGHNSARPHYVDRTATAKYEMTIYTLVLRFLHNATVNVRLSVNFFYRE